jgi:hypothetical protein
MQNLTEIWPFAEEKPIIEAEALAALMAVTHACSVAPDFANINVYTDNQAVLYSLTKGKGVIFLLNDVKSLFMNLIKEMSRNVTWRFVPTADNPADRPSRTVLPPYASSAYHSVGSEVVYRWDEAWDGQSVEALE